MESQQQVWDNIAEEWDKFRKEPILEVMSFLKKQKGKILDLGCGSGRHLIKNEDIKFYEVDFSKKMIKFAKQKAEKEDVGAEFFVSQAENLPFEDNFFDSAIFMATLQCIEGEENRDNSVKELFRVLKPGAKALISVWNKDSKRFKNSPKEKYRRGEIDKEKIIQSVEGWFAYIAWGNTYKLRKRLAKEIEIMLKNEIAPPS